MAAFLAPVDVIDNVLNGAEFFCILVGDLDTVSFFERHDEFHHFERVRT